MEDIVYNKIMHKVQNRWFRDEEDMGDWLREQGYKFNVCTIKGGRKYLIIKSPRYPVILRIEEHIRTRWFKQQYGIILC